MYMTCAQGLHHVDGVSVARPGQVQEQKSELLIFVVLVPLMGYYMTFAPEFAWARERAACHSMQTKCCSHCSE